MFESEKTTVTLYFSERGRITWFTFDSNSRRDFCPVIKTTTCLYSFVAASDAGTALASSLVPRIAKGRLSECIRVSVCGPALASSPGLRLANGRLSECIRVSLLICPALALSSVPSIANGERANWLVDGTLFTNCACNCGEVVERERR